MGADFWQADGTICKQGVHRELFGVALIKKGRLQTDRSKACLVLMY